MSTEIKLPAITSETQIAMLAQDFASNLMDTSQILEKYGLSTKQVKKIVRTTEFKTLYAQARQQWDVNTNAEERIRSKSKMMVEDSLQEVFGIVHDAETSPSSKLEGFKQLVGVADLNPKKEQGGTGEKVSIVINVPPLHNAPAKTLTIDGEVLANEQE